MTSSDALLHGDLHTGSIMTNENETYVIDPEFAFVGPFGFDIGALIANLINSYISHTVVSTNEEYKKWLLEIIEDTYTKFEEKFLALWEAQKDSALLRENFISDDVLSIYKKEFMANIFTTTVGFAACKITRRVFGVAGVEEIRGLEDKALRKEAELKALKLGQKLVLEYKNIKDIKELINIVKEI
jgi:5-methylthioribose kinase